jgi:hypothetical protein
MSQIFRLYWLRENACDAGILVQAAALDPSIRHRVLELADSENGEFAVRLPFFDQREWRARSELLPQIPMERVGNLIRSVLGPRAATRDLAATLALTESVWKSAPAHGHATFSSTWQRVSLALQKRLRQGIAEEFLRDAARCEDRAQGYALAVYQASRPFSNRARAHGEFAYDLRDYPDCRSVLNAAMRHTGQTTQVTLAGVEQKLREAHLPDLARRYDPVWFEDIQIAVRKKPRRFVDLLATDCIVVDAVIDLAASPTTAAINRSARMINRALRKVLGLDMRRLGVEVLEEATRVLTQVEAGEACDSVDARTLQRENAVSPRRPQS